MRKIEEIEFINKNKIYKNINKEIIFHNLNQYLHNISILFIIEIYLRHKLSFILFMSMKSINRIVSLKS